MDAAAVAAIAGRVIDARPGTGPVLRPATVRGGGTTNVAVQVDDSNAAGEPATITAANLTGRVLLVGDRVMVQFQPPHGVFIVGVITAALPGVLDKKGPLTVAAASLTFTIPAGWTNILFRVCCKTSNAADQNMFATLNGDNTAAHYFSETLTANSAAAAASITNPTGMAVGYSPATANRLGAYDFRLYNYANGFEKMGVSTGGELGTSFNLTTVIASRWSGSTGAAPFAAITTVTFTLAAGNIDVGSVITMIGEA